MRPGFCNYCDCADDEGNQRTDLSHAQTSNGKWICDICYYYDECLRSPDNLLGHPCKENPCKHQPKIITKWATF